MGPADRPLKTVGATSKGEGHILPPNRQGPNWPLINSRVQQRLFHICKEARKSAKKARVAAVQKLVKMLRSAQLKSKSDDVPDSVKLARSKDVEKLTMQLELLKKCDIENIVTRSLVEAIRNSRLPNPSHILSLDTHLAAGQLYGKAEWTPTDKRILSVKVFSDSLDEHIADLDALIHGRKYVKVKRAKATTATSAKEKLDGLRRKNTTQSVNKAVSADMRLATHSGDLSVSESDDHMSVGSYDSGDEMTHRVNGSDGEDCIGLNDRIWSGSDSDSGDGQGSISISKLVGSKLVKPMKLDSVLPRQKKSTIPPVTTKSKGQMKSVFVPTLGGDLGDVSVSDDEFSGNEFDDNGNKIKRVKKSNRMGQRARRELWESQYGKNAIHIKTQQEKEKLAARRRKGNPTNTTGNARHDASERSAELAHIPSAAPLTQEDLSVLHPSWQAKRKVTTAIAEFQGTRIKFGDNGETKDTVSAPTTTSRLAPPKPPIAPVKPLAEKLHPSWEAKRRAKELEERRKVSGKATKITFDADD
ncbi:hypothetical protein BASA50_008564 [Batrachochytrium salamandrivorans]|uniref:Bud22 domain-containing protein n=1 Tax=Batrachochytrium salamandrivorans TaxID=1357716 RepID=A0ABQ8F4R3_9FUNG|nr:hypothetical protein BASA62_010287 [Batrachochytrium salamandrivorans]KAH6591590.1 hypothetical protein BASA50_008564 [Batrachochytrium salamandrivorans]KAH9252136.1 hypothetical protein BASA81_009986 [Batrachochytrium salamandrivorans]KAH9263875.1 hypothetical protein BASA83_012693 [Batrachochytrium salamandrivorans]